jgi:hypothetical protein
MGRRQSRLRFLRCAIKPLSCARGGPAGLPLPFGGLQGACKMAAMC